MIFCGLVHRTVLIVAQASLCTKFFKDDARHTQKNTESFDMQTARRNAESHAINQAIRESVPTQHKSTTIPLPKENADTGPSCMAQGAMWFVAVSYTHLTLPTNREV